MSAVNCARAILKYVEDPETAVIFVAIAGAESGYRLNAKFDALGGPYACNEYCSWGPWQINICAHHNWLKDIVGSSNPCTIANWLISSYENSALAAVTVWQRAGNSFCPWTVYEESCSPKHNGRYRKFLPEARAAVEEVLGTLPAPTVQGSHYCVDEETVAVSLWWNPVPNATRYEVWHTDIEKLADTQETHFEYQVYSPHWREGAEYTIRVRACNNGTCSDWAEYKAVAACGKAIPPGSLVAVALLAILFGGTGVGLIAFAHKEALSSWWQKAKYAFLALIAPP